MNIVYVVLGILFAVGGAHYLVDGGSALARRFNVSTMVIGSTVVAFGTSMPEFTVNINSAMHGSTDLALGNILGSNLFNICVVIGVVSLIAPIPISQDARTKDLPMCFLSALVVGVCGNQIYIDHINYHELFPSDGIIFLCFFAVFMRYVYAEAASGNSHHHRAKSTGLARKSSSDERSLSLAKALLAVVIGLTGLVVGGELIVDGASGIARRFHIEERVIGLLIVGPGTSLPELIASIAAARRKDVGMVLGNVLGSNIFNIFMTLGSTALIMPVPLDLALNVVVLVNIGVTALLMVYAFLDRQAIFTARIGLLLLLVYSGYTVWSLN